VRPLYFNLLRPGPFFEPFRERLASSFSTLLKSSRPSNFFQVSLLTFFATFSMDLLPASNSAFLVPILNFVGVLLTLFANFEAKHGSKNAKSILQKIIFSSYLQVPVIFFDILS
jgi:hypothetical protein